MTGLEQAARGFVLALEGSTERASCAVRGPGGAIVELDAPPGRRHVEDLPGLAADAAARAGVALSDLALVVVGSGPGSYMGIRATVAVANALSYAAACPIAEISTLDSLGIELASPSRETVVAIPAGRGRYFVASYLESDGVVHRSSEPELVEGGDLPEIDTTARPTARGHLEALAKQPGWVGVQASCAQPRYGPSGREG